MNRDVDRFVVTELALEQYRLGELPPSDAERIRTRLQVDEPLRRRLEALEQSDASISAGGIPDRLAASLAAAARPDRRGWLSTPPWRWSMAGGAAIAVLALIVARTAAPPAASAPTPAPSLVDDGERIKGLQPALTLFRRTGDGSETLADGSLARAGDVIRIGYRAAGRAYGVILSIDGRGAVTLHLPASDGDAAALKPGATVLLDQAYELDDAPRWERFYFVTADKPFETAAVIDVARRVAHADRPPVLSLTTQFTQSAFSLVKETRP